MSSASLRKLKEENKWYDSEGWKMNSQFFHNRNKELLDDTEVILIYLIIDVHNKLLFYILHSFKGFSNK